MVSTTVLASLHQGVISLKTHAYAYGYKGLTIDKNCGYVHQCTYVLMVNWKEQVTHMRISLPVITVYMYESCNVSRVVGYEACKCQPQAAALLTYLASISLEAINFVVHICMLVLLYNIRLNTVCYSHDIVR